MTGNVAVKGMSLLHRCSRFITGLLTVVVLGTAQKAPLTSERPWSPPLNGGLSHNAAAILKTGNEFVFQSDKRYALAELIDVAEQRNPETRAAWQAAKQQAAQLGVAKADLYPTLGAAVVGQTLKTGVLLNNGFVLQYEGIGQGDFNLSYTLLDFGARQDRIARERAALLGSNFTFNDTHRRVIFEVMRAYYQLLNANGQRRAAEANLKNAQGVQQAAEARLQTGLATLPDVLEARAGTAQAEYDLQTTVGAQESATGDLATALTASPTSRFQIEDIDALAVPNQLVDSAEDLIHRAFEQRPDLQARAAAVQGAESAIREARSAYFPNLTFQGSYGFLRAYGEQLPYPGSYAGSSVYNAQLSLSWTLFDGGKRWNQLAEAHAEEKRAEAEVDTSKDQISNEVWQSYSSTKTALRQRNAATQLLSAADASYNAALQSYNLGVRNILDVLSSQRALAQARAADISARTAVLISFADLAFRTGDMLRQQTGKPKP
jgi:outer membrane protein